MSDFNPGDGWRKVGTDDGIGQDRILRIDRHDVRREVWVREEPVPPLPTEEHTVIEVTWREPSREPKSALMWDGFTWSAAQVGSFQPGWLSEQITGFEVLAEPLAEKNLQFEAILDQHGEDLKRVRRETAKAVLDRARMFMDMDGEINRTTLKTLAYEFEVES